MIPYVLAVDVSNNCVSFRDAAFLIWPKSTYILLRHSCTRDIVLSPLFYTIRSIIGATLAQWASESGTFLLYSSQLKRASNVLTNHSRVEYLISLWEGWLCIIIIFELVVVP